MAHLDQKLIESQAEYQIARSLRVYYDRNEWDGSYKNACACLISAGYPMTPEIRAN